MTGKQLLELALVHLAEPPSSSIDYQGYSVGVINIIVSETFDINNTLLKSKGKEVIENVPLITSMNDEIPYDIRLMVECLSYGVAAKLILEDNDNAKFNYFNSMYADALMSKQKLFHEKIYDMYGDDHE